MEKFPIDSIKPLDDSGILNVIIETPKGSRNKYAWDEKHKIFKLKSILAEGLTFPYDFGFLPGTKGGDGDPLDVLLLMDEPTYPGILVEANILGVLKAKKKKKGKAERNDRLIAAAKESIQYQELKNLKDMPKEQLDQLIHFFEFYTQEKGEEFELMEVKGPKSAIKIIKDGIKNKS